MSSEQTLNYCIFFSGASLIVAIQAVKKGAAAEGMKVKDYVWRGHDPTSVAVMTEVNRVCYLCALLVVKELKLLNTELGSLEQHFRVRMDFRYLVTARPEMIFWT